jgi:hypothetical protein
MFDLRENKNHDKTNGLWQRRLQYLVEEKKLKVKKLGSMTYLFYMDTVKSFQNKLDIYD